jgi:hypothetical protein
MPLSKGFEVLALKIQEAAIGMTHGNVRNALEGAVMDAHATGQSYGHYVDHSGDGESGDCIYTTNGELCSAPYTIGTVGGKMHASIDHEKREPVMANVTYHPKATDDDHYTAMESAGFYEAGSARYAERFISKGERDKADAGDFAGKGKSFPILKPEDVGAAVHAMGRAGSANYGMSGLKSRIIAIAKKKGWTSHLPKSWQDGEDKECMDSVRETEIVGDAIPLKEGAVGQDGTAYLKLISPGRGSSGYYPADVLERDGPRVFKKGTKNFWNHQTDAEEAARPEGDLRDLASVLTEDAHYEHAGPAGPGLYAKAEVQPHYRGPVDSLAKHIGMSIRATGKAKEGKAPDGKTGPIIEQLTRGISVDYVTTPGAGGQILQLFEAARGSRQIQVQESQDMADDARLQEALAQIRKLNGRLALTEAAGVISGYFQTVRVGEAIRQRVTQNLLSGTMPLTASGELDSEKLGKMAEAATKEECDYVSRLSGGAIVFGMGAPVTTMTEADRKALADAEAREFTSTMGELAGFVMGEASDGADKQERKKFKRLHDAFINRGEAA